MESLPGLLDHHEVTRALYEVRGLEVSFGDKAVLTGVDLDIHEREVLTLIGVSGSGKSVLVKSLIGLNTVQAGSICFDGRDYRGAAERDWMSVRRRVGMLFQEGALFDSQTVFTNITYGLREHRLLPEDQIPARVAESLESVALPGIEEMRPRDLSGGMQKRVGLARAIAMRPQLIFYDEPTEGLDPINVTRVNRLLLRLRDRHGVTPVIVTHNMRSAFGISDRVVMLDGGKIALDGKPEELRTSGDERLAAFLAAAEMSVPQRRRSLPPPA